MCYKKNLKIILLNYHLVQYNVSKHYLSGTVTHDFTDLTYADVEAYCLAITDKEVSAGRRRTPKFISAGPSSFRSFGLLNFNSVNFLSSGTSK